MPVSGLCVVAPIMATDYSDVHRHLESGLVLTRYYLKKQEKLTFRVRLETRQLIWVRVHGQTRPEDAVDLRLVKEIRPGREVKEFDRSNSSFSSAAVSYGSEDKKDKYCFSIHYGSTFRLKVLALQAPNQEEFFLWTEGLQNLCNSTRAASYSLQVERWLRKEFYEMKTKLDCVSIKDLKAWLPKLNCKISNNRLQECYQKVEPKLKDIGFDQFARIFRDLVYSPTIFRDYLEAYSEEKTVRDTFGERTGIIISAEKFANFLAEIQKEEYARDVQAVRSVMADFVGDPMRPARQAYFTPQEFEDYLFSPQNSVCDPEKMSPAAHNMTRPLSHYWIASSHNTYLTGDQFKSESSTEAYLQVLRMGARCVELDCWDGPDGSPIIYHGHTLTSKIKFYDTLRTIKKYAWAFSEYPLVLSIENHCSLPQQRLMASMFREVFGDDLLTDLVDRNSTVLPSPERLKRKIIIKYKKLPDSALSSPTLSSATSMTSLYGRDEAADLNDLSQSVKTGIMYMQDSVDNAWCPHYFVLSNNKLCYTDKMTSDGQDEMDDSSSISSQSSVDESSSNGQRSSDVPNHELHYSEAWFHGRLSGGRLAADRLLKQHSSLGDGAFLVRESETFVGDYTLSFWRQGKVNHCRIKSRQDGPNVKYFLVDNAVFNSLYELVTHYRTNALRSESFWLVLTEAVPQPDEHVGKPWYNENVSREQAEDMLCRLPIDGAFLVRKRTGDELALSFRADGKIKHCKIFREGRLFTIGSATFESLTQLVQYYERNPLYRRVTLRKAVNEDVVTNEGVEPDQCELYGTDIYHEPLTVRVRALYDFRSDKPLEELSFPRGAIINNVVKTGGDWWKGDYGGRRKLLFPANYVEELPDEDLSASSADSDASRALGAMEKGAVSISTDCSCTADGVIRADIGRGAVALYRMRIITSEMVRPLEAAVTEDTDRSDWMAKIKECSDRSVLVEKGLKQAEQQMKIAKELSDLVVYCRSVPYNPEAPGHYSEMASLAEVKAEKTCSKRDNKGKQFLQFNRSQISRIYPHGGRINSSNYEPQPFWCCGSHMVALNYQTGDRPMQLNQGRFLQSGLSGYVLQPDCLKHPDYDPFEKRTLVGVDPLTISVTIVGARHLLKQGRGIACPFVEVEIVGAYYDIDNNYKTRTKMNNGLNPVWAPEVEQVEFDIDNPQLALIRFCVQDEDMFGDPNFLGQASLPVSCLRSGLRSVPLKNEYSDDLELASLLIQIDLFNPKETDESEIYSSVQQLRDRSLQLHEELDQPASDAAHQELLRHELRTVENSIHAQRELRREKRMSVRAPMRPPRR